MTYSHDEEAIALRHLCNRLCWDIYPKTDLYTIGNFFSKGLVFPIDLVYLVNSVQIIYT
ncbi:hypothetical protein [Nostoc sp.]